MFLDNVNQIQLGGRVGQDPETKHTPNGSMVTKFSIATSHSYKKGEDWVKETNWTNIVVWGNEGTVNLIHKGSLVYIPAGRLVNRSYDDKKTGEKKYITEVVTDKICFLRVEKADGEGGSRPKSSGSTQKASAFGGGASKPAQSAPSGDDWGDFDDNTDIPF
jgi:single-strand DNA-binding protein